MGKQINKYAIKLVKLKDELTRAGYPQTSHALEAAVKQIGWELAEKSTNWTAEYMRANPPPSPGPAYED